MACSSVENPELTALMPGLVLITDGGKTTERKTDEEADEVIAKVDVGKNYSVPAYETRP